MAGVGGCSGVGGEAVEGLQDFVRALVGEFAFLHEVIVKAEGEVCGGDSAVDLFEEVAGDVAFSGDVGGSEEFGEADGGGDVVVVFDDGGVVGDTADVGLVQLFSGGEEEVVLGMA